MSTYNEQPFHLGIIRDGDPHDRPGYNMMLNADPAPGIWNDFVCRKPCQVYNPTNTERTVIEVLDGMSLPDVVQPTLVNVASWIPWNLMYWESGIEKPQMNALMIYRSVASTTVGSQTKWQWQVWTNAPSLSRMNDTTGGWTQPTQGWQNDWLLLETITAPVCNAEVLGASIRIALGTETDYRILTDLCIDGTRYYFKNATVPIITISRQTLQHDPYLGAGGRIESGWYWDYGKLYSPFVLTGTPSVRPMTVAFDIVSASSVSKTPIVGQPDSVILVAPVYDNDPEQIGAPFVYAIPGIAFAGPLTMISGMDNYCIKVTFTPGVTTPITNPGGGEYYIDPRITGFNLYWKRSDPATGIMEDFLLAENIDVKDIVTTGTDVYIDQVSFDTAVIRSWIGDTSGRAVDTDALTSTLVDKTSIYVWKFIVQTSNDTSINADVADFTIKPTGFAPRKEVHYAWGVDGDAGQMQIRESELPSNRGNYDIWPKDAVTWKPGASEAITCLSIHDDRIYQFHENSVYHLEVTDKLRARESYLYEEDSATVGLPKEYTHTLVWGLDGGFFCNDAGIWVVRSGQRAVNIIEGSWLETWKSYTKEQRRGCVTGWDDKYGEFWVVIPKSENTVHDPTTGVLVPIDQIIEGVLTPTLANTTETVWIFADRDVQHKYWRVYQYPSFQIFVFLTDRYNNFLCVGRRGNNYQAVLPRYEGSLYLPGDFSTDSAIYTRYTYMLWSNTQGIHPTDNVIYEVFVDRTCWMHALDPTTGLPINPAHKMTIELFGPPTEHERLLNIPQTAWDTLYLAGCDSLKTTLAMTPLEVTEFSWRISGLYPQDPNDNILPRISTVVINTKEKPKRRG